ncbi:hypothetical protein [Synechococcus elongatus]|uniref:Uncharacterized protein n=2 Tax=Synechococcus elongatus TaxID=32046 RepID=Q31KG7_SYNE7|nr:hypothetical protein [Synechococcus elongatus]ABB58452.1 conserved hypothetical protein [Synechococcus elongatus PCC 7942 = FACHB-805]AJD57087.1 hypothetical protein M744_04135 [Synechococcus elongatus UTEX 2973]MBD2587172.1 hypothetical protein [Synechococcus elongatus FACHB-242]MBD2688243.1 hypothetical protein [Synechococcus elongatus FACHB-1061]MBD2706046.1 hypothetical protein [Synechococcus elongatus PCC 7942 = FACHB-805]
MTAGQPTEPTEAKTVTAVPVLPTDLEATVDQTIDAVFDRLGLNSEQRSLWLASRATSPTLVVYAPPPAPPAPVIATVETDPNRDRWRLVFAAIALVLAAGLGFWNLRQWQQQTALASSAENQEFASYLSRSLDLLEADPTAETAIASNPTAVMPPLAGLIPPPPPNGNTGTLPPPAPITVAPTSVGTLPPPPPLLPAPPVSSGGSTVSQPPAPPVTAAPTPVAASRTLNGVIDLGDRSTALFTINGASQQVGVGQSLGDGYVVKQITSQSVTLGRGGSQQTIPIGGSF